MLEDSERVSRSNLASMNDELVGLKKRLVETEAAWKESVRPGVKFLKVYSRSRSQDRAKISLQQSNEAWQTKYEHMQDRIAALVCRNSLSLL